MGFEPTTSCLGNILRLVPHARYGFQLEPKADASLGRRSASAPPTTIMALILKIAVGVMRM
jgi:hypothetical protein